jgi:hypothetical protein
MRDRSAPDPHYRRREPTLSDRCETRLRGRRCSVIRTAGIANRDKRVRRGRLRPEPAVSGWDSPIPNRQDPAEPRHFIGSDLDVWGKSLLAQTQWRWGEYGGNWSLGQSPVRQGKYREIFDDWPLPAELQPGIPCLTIGPQVRTRVQDNDAPARRVNRSPCVFGEMREQQGRHPVGRSLQRRLMDVLHDLEAIGPLHPVRVGLD